MFSEKIRHGISCESSARQTVQVECQVIFFFFFEKKKKKNRMVPATILLSALRVNHSVLTLVVVNKLRCHAHF